MSIDRSHQNPFLFSWSKVLKPSHRTNPEQLVGLSIFLLICLGFEVLSGLTTQPLYFLSLGFSMWTLWRRYSLRVLKLEVSLFSAQFFFQIAWSFSYFVLQEMLLALVVLLLLWCNTLLATLLFWKKERLSGWLLLFPLVWVFYLVGSHMVPCMSNNP